MKVVRPPKMTFLIHPSRPLRLLIACLLLLPALARANNQVYVAPDGTPSAAGTLAAPTTLDEALLRVLPGGTIHLRGGTYAFNYQVTIDRTNSGTDATARKRLFAYVPPSGVPELPRLDFSTQPYGTSGNPRGLQINGNWWHIRGLEVFGSADNGIFIGGNHNIVERCITRHNRDTGLQISRWSSTAGDISEWPSHNLILNCLSHDNYDSPPGSGENADGFACKLTSGPGNIFRGCVARNNIDDGWDLFTNSGIVIGPVVIDQCIAYNNGVLSDGSQSGNGDRNGFKLGGSSVPIAHTVTRSIAFGNGKNGFTWNSNPGAIRMFNNLAWNNAQGNYKFDQAGPIFLNNVSLWTSGNGVNDRYGGASGIATGPSNVFWFASGTPKSRNDQGLQVSAASFVSLTPPVDGFARFVDGSLNLGNFARLVAGSPLVNKGTTPDASHWPELVYAPSAYHEGLPDIGVREVYLSTAPFFVLQPQGTTVFGGATIVLTGLASGTEPLTYQWLVDDQPITGATDTTLILTGATPAQSGTYRLRATNTVQSSLSSPAEVLVVTPVAPVVTTDPASQTIPLGQPVTFSVQASGTEPFSYQWFFAGNPIAGATGATFTLPATTVADQGGYTVLVSNTAGSDLGGPAQLTVDTTPVAPVITVHPTSPTVLIGSTATLTIGATGTPPLTYQWRRRGAHLPGENAPALVLSPVQLVHASDYDVVVSNAGGSAVSNTASLVVLASAPESLVNDSFADGTRATQSLPASVAWWGSSGSGNFTAVTGTATQIASSSRTVLGYFTNSPDTPVQLAVGQSLTFSTTLAFTGFDDAAAIGASNFHIGLLRSVANPAAVSGTGFAPAGTPNTNARVTGDYGSSFPSSGVFLRYEGYTAFSQARTTAVEQPTSFRVRNLTDNGLLASATAYTTLTADPQTASLPLATGVAYRATLTVARTPAGIELSYSLRRVSDDVLMASGTARDPEATFTAFDTFALYFGKASATPTYNLTFTNASISRTSSANLDPATWAAGWSLTGGAAEDPNDPDADGAPNLLEFALGLSPTVADATPANLPAYLPAIGGNPATFRFARPRGLAGVTYIVELSTDLSTWTPAPAPTIEGTTPATETVLTVLPAQTPNQFVRLRVVRP